MLSEDLKQLQLKYNDLLSLYESFRETFAARERQYQILYDRIDSISEFFNEVCARAHVCKCFFSHRTACCGE